MTKLYVTFTSLFISISLIIIVQSSDYGFFYDNLKEEIIFDDEYNTFQENLLINSSNKTMDYFS